MAYKVKQEELIPLCQELAHTLNNLRHYTKEWEKHYGSRLRNYKRRWEQKADQLLERLDLHYEPKDTKEDVKIESDSGVQ